MRMSGFRIDGIVPIIPTPFSQDGSPDWDALGRLLDFAVKAEVNAVCLPAYASEFYKLTDGERRDVASRAIDLLGGRLPLIAQVNHVSPAYVAETARDHEQAGASAISVAVPRLFGLPERDLLRYFDRILNAISIPLLIQDFNPGGPTLSTSFLHTLHSQHPHFKFLKLEEPLMAQRVRSILDSTAGEIGVIEGWGGMYMLELIDAGICGVMPGLAVSDILRRIWNLARAGDKDGAYSVFAEVLPQVVFSLQSLEFFHHAEKSLLVARGILPNANVREATLTIDVIDEAHTGFLNAKFLSLVESLGLQTSFQPVGSKLP
jgi:dihydrodipicolinate synthase/N-acetylneuraminate lyase